MAKWLEGTVVENRRWNERLCSLRFVVDDMPAFEAGQFVRLGLEIDGEIEARPYSLINAPGEQPCEVYFNRVEEGPLSPRLFALEPGDGIQVASRPAGYLVMSEVPSAEVLWLLATGTAIGPFISILKTAEPWRRFGKIILVHGVRHADERVYQPVLQQLQQQHPEQLQLYYSVTGESVAGTLQQRISNAIVDGGLEALTGQALEPQSAQIMICGNPPMVEECQQLLKALGFRKNLRQKPGQVTTEIYQ